MIKSAHDAPDHVSDLAFFLSSTNAVFDSSTREYAMPRSTCLCGKDDDFTIELRGVDRQLGDSRASSASAGQSLPLRVMRRAILPSHRQDAMALAQRPPRPAGGALTSARAAAYRHGRSSVGRSRMLLGRLVRWCTTRGSVAAPAIPCRLKQRCNR